MPPWLFEIHKVLWNKPEQRVNLYRKITLTFADFLRLDNQLNTHTEGDPSVYGKACKLAFLREHIDSAATSEPTLSDDDVDREANVDPRYAYESYFPIAVQYLDLSSLPLEAHPLRCPSLIYIREEYGIITDLLNREEHLGLTASAIVSGQPGIGKTRCVCLSYLIAYSV